MVRPIEKQLYFPEIQRWRDKEAEKPSTPPTYPKTFIPEGNNGAVIIGGYMGDILFNHFYGN